MTEEWRHFVSGLKAALRRRRSSTELNTLTKELARDGWSQSTTDDIMKEAELSRRDEGIKRFTVVQKVHMQTQR